MACLNLVENKRRKEKQLHELFNYSNHFTFISKAVAMMLSIDGIFCGAFFFPIGMLCFRSIKKILTE